MIQSAESLGPSGGLLSPCSCLSLFLLPHHLLCCKPSFPLLPLQQGYWWLHLGSICIIQGHLFISNLPSSLCQVSCHTLKFWTLGLLTLLGVIIQSTIPEIENCDLWTRSGLSPVYGNKIVLEHTVVFNLHIRFMTAFTQVKQNWVTPEVIWPQSLKYLV